MKRTILLFTACLCLCTAVHASAQESRLFIFLNEVRTPPELQGLFSHFSAGAARPIEKEFPCLYLNDTSGLRAMLELSRWQQLLGTPDDSAISMANIAGSLGGEIFIYMEASYFGEKVVVSANAMQTRTMDSLLRRAQVAVNATAAADNIERFGAEFGKELVKGLAYFQPCSYVGNMTITVRKTVDRNETQQAAVFCNQKEGVHKTVTKVTGTEDTVWTLERKVKKELSGYVTHKVISKTEITDDDACYACTRQRREGGRSYTSTTELQGTLAGIANYGGNNYARLKIRFPDDKHYILEIDASSNKATMTPKKTERAVGTCDPIPDPKDPAPKPPDAIEVSVPLPAVLGPFEGTPMDKVLKKHIELPSTGDKKGEKTITIVDFELTRK